MTEKLTCVADETADEKLKETILSAIHEAVPQENRESVVNICMEFLDIMDGVDARDIYYALSIIRTFVKSFLENNGDTVQ